jgi:pimeloyl-ACP methyl ester carboxylesterase
MIAREGFVSRAGLRLHYLDWGTPGAPPVLLLHGGSAHAHWWDLVAPALADRRRCVAMDLRGHGDSDWPSDCDYRLSSHATDVDALVESLGLKQFAIVGHSFGGFVAMTYAPRAAARVTALAIVDSRARISQRSARFMDALRKLPHPVYPSIETALERFRLLPSATTAAPDVIATVARHGFKQRPDGRWTFKFDRRAMAGTPPQDLSSALAALACPILAVRAAHSSIVTSAALAEFTAANPRVQLAEIADAHHHVMLDQPERLALVLRAFLDASSVGRGG